MIRLVLQKHERDLHSGMERKDLVTLDVDLPELESLLRRGGYGESGFEVWQLLGAEVREAANG